MIENLPKSVLWITDSEWKKSANYLLNFQKSVVKIQNKWYDIRNEKGGL